MGKVKELMYGDTIETVGQLRMIMSDLDDHDQLVLVTCDEYGDEQDHYPMAIDVIGGIKLIDDTIVREVQFVQRPNSEPDTRDKSDLIDAVIKQLMDDYYHGDETCWVELLEHLPWEILKQSLPEDQWEKFSETGIREDLINRVFQKLFGDDDPKNDATNRAFLESLSNEELESKL
jgi:hypothetical protein